MGYFVYKFQNVSSFSNDIPTISIDNNDPNWEIIYQNWLNGNNPTNDKEWKKGVYALTKVLPVN